MVEQQVPEIEYVTISRSEYNDLLHDREWLGYLEAAGIDNAEAYDYACDLARQDGFFDEDDDDS